MVYFFLNSSIHVTLAVYTSFFPLGKMHSLFSDLYYLGTFLSYQFNSKDEFLYFRIPS